MPTLADLVGANIATAGSINDKLIGFFSLIYTHDGTPENVVDAPLGAICIDFTTPNWYLKTTATGTLTGWKAITHA